MLFNFGVHVFISSKQNSQLDVPKCLVLGPVKKAFEYTLLPGAEILVANFKADAFCRFFGSRILVEQKPVNPDEFLEENCFTALWYELKKMASPTERVEYILEFCKPYLGDFRNGRRKA